MLCLHTGVKIKLIKLLSDVKQYKMFSNLNLAIFSAIKRKRLHEEYSVILNHKLRKVKSTEENYKIYTDKEKDKRKLHWPFPTALFRL